MRVCFLSEYFYPEVSGGSPKFLSELVWFLAENFHDLDVSVVTSRNLYRTTGPRPGKRERWGRVNIHRVASPRSNRPGTAGRLAAGGLFALAAAARLSSGRRFDAVVVNTNPPAAPMAALCALRTRRIPYLYLVHDLYPDLPVGRGLLRRDAVVVKCARGLQRTWLEAAAAVVVIGRCCAAHLTSAYGLDPAKIEFIPNWEAGDLVPIPATDSSWRRSIGLPGCVFLYAGNLGPMQNLGVLLDAAELLRDEEGVTIAIVGAGASREQLSGSIKRMGLKNTRILDPVAPADFPDLLCGADVHIVSLASNLEGLAVPSKLYSCLASGRPVIAVAGRESEVSRVVEENGAGVQVSPRDPATLAQAVRVLTRDAELRQRYGAAARRAVTEHFTLGLQAPKYREAILRAVAGGRR